MAKIKQEEDVVALSSGDEVDFNDLDIMLGVPPKCASILDVHAALDEKCLGDLVIQGKGVEEEIKPSALEEEMLKKMGFTNFSTKWQKIQEEHEEVDNDMDVKEEYPSFRCEVCNLELNSIDTLTSHEKGMRHMKNVKLQAAARGEILVVPPSTSTRIKVPVKLKEKMRECNDALVGLKFVREVLPISNQEMEPHYYCKLCNQQGQANCMLLHLKGRIHRQQWVHAVFNSADMVELSQAQLKLKAEEMDERREEVRRVESGEESVIETILSDEAFPWPAGKAPWLKENGGTGIVPDGALEKFGISSRCRQISVATAEEEFKVAVALPSKEEEIKEPKNIKEAKQMLALAESMMAAAVECGHLNLKEQEVTLMKAGSAALNLKLDGDEEQGSRSKRHRSTLNIREGWRRT